MNESQFSFLQYLESDHGNTHFHPHDSDAECSIFSKARNGFLVVWGNEATCVPTRTASIAGDSVAGEVELLPQGLVEVDPTIGALQSPSETAISP